MDGDSVMKYYKNKNSGEVFAYETESDREKYGAKELVKMTQQEIEAHLNPPPQPISETLERTKNELRAMREPMLSAVTGIGWEASEAGDAELVQEARDIRNALRDITVDPALNSAKTYEEMRAAGVAAFRRIASDASEAFSATFREFK